MLEELLEKANNLPQLPGVYMMLDAGGEVIYVGKAKKLKNRVTSYFRGKHLPKVQAMVDKVETFNVIVVDSEFEALVLENSLIKQHKPHYNILLKDDKGYPFIRLDTSKPYPRFQIVSRPAEDGAEYYGPYGGRSVSREIIDVVSKSLGLPDCGRVFPRDFGKDRPCLNYHMGNCRGWCRGNLNKEEYDRAIGDASSVLKGKTDELLSGLQMKMEEAAEELKFEQAAEYRDRIRAVKELSNKQKVIATAFSDTDAWGFCRGAKTCAAVLHFNDGRMTGKDYEYISEPLEDDGEALSMIVRQFYAKTGVYPKYVLLPVETGDMEALQTYFSEDAGRRVYVENPKRGDRAHLVQQANMNAREEILRATTMAQRKTAALEWLQKSLYLPEYPARIEAFDVSNLGDSGIVAAMTVHRDGKPLKKDYRRFRIKDIKIRDDYACMRQAIHRRFSRYKDGDEKFSSLPQLLLIDGGETHAKAAKEELEALDITVPVFGMVKDDRHRTRALITAEGEEISINSNQAVFSLIGAVQEETHRFAIEYQRSLRNESLGSELEKIPGVGEKRRIELLRRFKTMKAIKNADADELGSVLPKSTAEAVYKYFHETED